MATISVCMIVKNEERNLGLCLACLAGIADEMIIVDTGSTDRTKEIASLYTEHVHDFAWTGSFSEARNYAFSLATMDYIYSADADEQIDQENQIKFRLLKDALLPEIEIVQMRYANQLHNGGVYNFDEEYRPKLFRRMRTFRWVAPIHETVRIQPVVFNSEVIIGHYPKESHVGRDLAAFAKAAEREPLDARLHHMYAMELFIAGDNEAFLQARPYFESTLEQEHRSYEELSDARCVIARAARLSKDDPLFYRAALHAVVGNSPAEICCEIGHFYRDKGDWQEAAGWYYTAARGAQSILDARTSGVIPMEGMAQCCKALGEAEQAEAWEKEAKEWSPEPLRQT